MNDRMKQSNSSERWQKTVIDSIKQWKMMLNDTAQCLLSLNSMRDHGDKNMVEFHYIAQDRGDEDMAESNRAIER